MPRTIGSKNTVKLPTRYERGYPAVNFWLAILGQAYKDTKWHYAREMRADFEKTGLYRQRNAPDILGTAWWVVQYVNERWCA